MLAADVCGRRCMESDPNFGTEYHCPHSLSQAWVGYMVMMEDYQKWRPEGCVQTKLASRDSCAVKVIDRDFPCHSKDRDSTQVSGSRPRYELPWDPQGLCGMVAEHVFVWWRGMSHSFRRKWLGLYLYNVEITLNCFQPLKTPSRSRQPLSLHQSPSSQHYFIKNYTILQLRSRSKSLYENNAILSLILISTLSSFLGLRRMVILSPRTSQICSAIQWSVPSLTHHIHKASASIFIRWTGHAPLLGGLPPVRCCDAVHALFQPCDSSVVPVWYRGDSVAPETEAHS